MPRWLFLYWRHSVYLRSMGWYATTREKMRQAKGCEYRFANNRRCKAKKRLQVHHLNHFGQPRPEYWQLLPFARFFMHDKDYSDLIVLCDEHHAETHRAVCR